MQCILQFSLISGLKKFQKYGKYFNEYKFVSCIFLKLKVCWWFFLRCLSIYILHWCVQDFFRYLMYVWPGHDIAAHQHTPFDAMALSKEKSIFILSIMDILEGKLFGIQDNCKMKHLKGDRKWLKPEEFSEHCVE